MKAKAKPSHRLLTEETIAEPTLTSTIEKIQDVGSHWDHLVTKLKVLSPVKEVSTEKSNPEIQVTVSQNWNPPINPLLNLIKSY